MKVFIAGIALACAGTVVTQLVMTPQHGQAQAAPAPAPAEDVTFPHITSLPFDAATYNMNQSIPYKSIDGPDPAKLWDASDGSTARSAEGWDGEPLSPPGGATSAKTGGTAAKTGATSKTAKAGTSKAPSAVVAPSPAKVIQGTKGKLATPQTLSQGPTAMPLPVALY